MKKTIKNVGMAMGLLLLIGQFTSCDQKSETAIKSETVIVNDVIEEETPLLLKARKPIVFITGLDKGNSQFYRNARNYFTEKGHQIIEDQYSIEEIIHWMNANATKNPYGEVHIVNISNPYKGMNLETVVQGEKITTETLRKNITQGTLPTLENVVTSNSKIIFHSYGIGQNMELMKTLKDAFVAEEVPNVIASSYATVFGGKFSNHYLAEPFYICYPTANSPGKMDLSKEIKKKYSEEREIDWFKALKNYEERYIGEAYTTQFNIPIEWTFDYHNTDEARPTFTSQEEVMDWIDQQEDLVVELEKLKIPVDKFRWQWKVKNSLLILKGKTTVLCVLKPLIKPYGDLKHIEPDTNNKRLYAIK